MEQRCRGAGGSEISMPSSMGHGISARELSSAVSEPFAPISSPAVPMSTTVSLQQPLPTLSSSAVTPRLGNGPGAAFPPDVPARAVPDPVVVTSSAARPAGATAGGAGGGSANHHARPATTAAATAKSPPAAAAKYRECLRNHAASVGGLVVDGCGEFMPGGEEGVGGGGDPLKCAVCGCHRSFHRKEVEGEQQHRPAIAPTPYYYHPHHFSAVTSNGNGGRRGATATTPTSRIQIPPPPLLALPPPLPRQQPQPQPPLNPSPMTTFGGPRGGNESSGGGGGTTTESSSEEMEAHTPVVPPPFSHAAASTASTHVQQQQAFPMVTPPPSSVLSRKRFRTKFTTEQKERMMGFSEALGWRMQRKDEGAVDRFCAEVGVPRKVFKVWMHNNKHISSSKKLQQLHEPDQQPQQTPSPP